MLDNFKSSLKTGDTFFDEPIFVILELHHLFFKRINYKQLTCFSYPKNSRSKMYHSYSGNNVNQQRNKGQIQEA